MVLKERYCLLVLLNKNSSPKFTYSKHLSYLRWPMLLITWKPSRPEAHHLSSHWIWRTWSTHCGWYSLLSQLTQFLQATVGLDVIIPWTDSSNNGVTGRHSMPLSLWQENDGLHQSPGNYRIRNLSLTMSSSLYLIYMAPHPFGIFGIQGKAIIISFLCCLQSVVKPDAASLHCFLYNTGTGWLDDQASPDCIWGPHGMTSWQGHN